MNRQHELLHAQLGNYRILRWLGSGGFAEVFLGEHVHLQTSVAIKVLRARDAQAGDFVREAHLLANLHHPGIVAIREFDFYQGRPYLVMEYLPGGSLRQRYPGGTRLPLEDIASIVRQLAGPLAYLHGRGQAHGDLKPENVLLSAEGTLHLSDFGIAALAGQSATLAGTVAYMAPEQLQGQIQATSDQYALGIMAYEWLSGQLPFTGSYLEIATQHALIPPSSLRELVPGLPGEIEAVILRALAKEPGQRYPDVATLAGALSLVCENSLPTLRRSPAGSIQLTGTLPASTTQSPPSSSGSRSRRALLTAGGAGLAALGLAGGGGYLWWQGQGTQARVPTPAPSSTARKARPQGSIYHIYHGQQGDITTLAWSPDGTRVASGSSNIPGLSTPDKDHEIHVWDALTGQHPVIYRGHPGRIYALAWSPGGKYIASGGEPGDVNGGEPIHVWEAATGKQVAVFSGDASYVGQILWLGPSKLLALGLYTGEIITWDFLTREKQIRSFSLLHTDKIADLSITWGALSPDGKYVIAADIASNVYRVVDGVQIGTDVSQGGCSPFAPWFWSPDGKYVLTRRYRFSPGIWSPFTAQNAGILSNEAAICLPGWSPDSQKVAAYGYNSGALSIWEAVGGKVLYHSIPHANEAVDSVAWSPDGQKIANGGADGSVEVWQAT